MTLHEVRFKVVTTCSTSAVDAFVIEISDRPGGTVLDTITEASTVTTVAGVTLVPALVGGLPRFDADDTQTLIDLRWTFVSFTTACGLELVGDRFDLDYDDAATAVAAEGACVKMSGGVRHMYGRATYCTTWIEKDTGHLIGIGGSGSYMGVLGQYYDTELAVPGPPGNEQWTYPRISATVRPRRFPNTAEYLPNERFAKHSSFTAQSISIALTESGRLFSWGHNGADTTTGDYPVISGRGPNVPFDKNLCLVPFEILAPNGEAWENFHVVRDIASVVASAAMVAAVTVGGVWYEWGNTVDSVTAANWPTSPLRIPAFDESNLFISPSSGLHIFINEDGDIQRVGLASTTATAGGWAGMPADALMTIPGSVKAVAMVSVGGVLAILGDDGDMYTIGGNVTGRGFSQGVTPTALDATRLVAVPVPRGDVPVGVTIVSLHQALETQLVIAMLGSDGKVYQGGLSTTTATAAWFSDPRISLRDLPLVDDIASIHNGITNGGVLYEKNDGTLWWDSLNYSFFTGNNGNTDLSYIIPDNDDPEGGYIMENLFGYTPIAWNVSSPESSTWPRQIDC